MRSFLRSCLSLSLVFSLTYSPLVTSYSYAKTASRTDFDNECKLPLSIMEQKVKNNCKNNGDTPTCKEIKKQEIDAGGDQRLAYCVQADMARQTKNVETAKSIIFLAGAVICTVEAIAEKAGEGFPLLAALAAQAKAVCMATSIAASAAGVVADITGKVILNKSKDKYGEAKDQVCSVMTFTPLVMSLTPLLMNGGAAGATGGGTGGGGGGSGSSNGGCLICAIMLALTGGVSVFQASSSKKAQDTFVKDAHGVSSLGNDSVTNLNPAQIHLQQITPEAVNPTSASGGSPAASDSCANQGGNQYLVCLGNQSPELSAISNSPAFLSQMQKSLKGQNLGDFVKNFPEDGDMAQYVANGLGVSPALVSGVMANNDKIAKESGYLDHYAPSGYSRAGGGKGKLGGGGDDMDFAKMMASMMGKLDPGAPQDKKIDPSEQVFRKMELLPADKIEGNKDISLFARIAFRYRKNANNVEQLNWARPENQSPAPKK